MRGLTIVAVVVFGLFLLLGSAAFVVSETEQVVLTQFGKPVGEAIKDAGLHFKIPFIQEANFFPKNLLEWDGEPSQMPTLDKTYIWVDTFARWLIKDPLMFFETVNNEIAGQKKLDDIIDPATWNLITSHHLIEAVRNSDRKMDMPRLLWNRQIQN
jgi:membrane protease subunit HflC